MLRELETEVSVPFRGTIYLYWTISQSVSKNTPTSFRPLSGNYLFILEVGKGREYRKQSFRPLSGNYLFIQEDGDTNTSYIEFPSPFGELSIYTDDII